MGYEADKKKDPTGMYNPGRVFFLYFTLSSNLKFRNYSGCAEYKEVAMSGTRRTVSRYLPQYDKADGMIYGL